MHGTMKLKLIPVVNSATCLFRYVQADSVHMQWNCDDKVTLNICNTWVWINKGSGKKVVRLSLYVVSKWWRCEYACRALLCFFDLCTRRGEGSESCSGRFLPPGKTRCPLYRRLGGPQSRSGQVWKISSPLGFDPRTVHPVASRYTVWVTRPTKALLKFL
jgi:hypothetical protein